MPRTIIKYGDVQRNSLRIFKKDGGIQRNIKRIYRKHLGVWQLVFGSSGTITYSTPGTYTFIPQPGTTSISVVMAGGSGGGGARLNNYGGGGGGATNAVSGTFNVVAGTPYTVIVGAGGAVQSAGGSSSITGLIGTGGGGAGVYSAGGAGANGGGNGQPGGAPTTTTTGGTKCFPAGTMVSTPDGLRNIEDLVVGDVVYALDIYNIDSDELNLPGTLVERQITQTLAHAWGDDSDDSKLIVIKYAGGELTLTGNHYVMTPSRQSDGVEPGFASASSLEVGDVIYNELGTELSITEIVAGPTYDFVYNLEVDVNHTFIANGIRVHNGGGTTTTTTTTTIVPGANGAGGVAGPGGRNGGAGTVAGSAGYVTINW